MQDIGIRGCTTPFEHFEALTKTCEEGRLNDAIQAVAVMFQRKIFVPTHIFYCVLQGCINKGDLASGRKVHHLIVWSGLECSAFLGSHLIRMFAVCKSLLEANQVFQRLPKRNVFAWSALISAHASLGRGEQAIRLYYDMQASGVEPDGHSFVAVLKACASTAALSEGTWVHTNIIEKGFESNVFVGNALIDMYAKFGSLEDTYRVFDNLPDRDIVTWNAMITGYAQHGCTLEALKLFQQMQQEGLKLNIITWNSMISGYAQHGHCEEAFQLFQQMRLGGFLPNNLTWNSMISGYAQHEYGHAALQLFHLMQMEGSKPDIVTFVSVLKACSAISALDKGKLVHIQIVENGFESYVIIKNTLIDMYAKCGNFKGALSIFNSMVERDLVSWNAIIGAHASHGHFQDVFQCFQQMQCEGMKPDQVTFVFLLKSCSSVGQGRVTHSLIMKSGCESDVFVGTTLIDMYMKCGSLDNACKVFSMLPKREVATWSALIAGYAWNGYSREAVWLVDQMQQQGLQPNSVTWNGIIAGCVHCGLYHEAARAFLQMQQEGLEQSKVSFVNVLKACSGIGDLDQGGLVHAHIVERGWESDVHIGSTLIDMYSNCANLLAASKVFVYLAKEVLVWNAMIGACAQHGHWEAAIQHFKGMQEEGMEPNQVTFVHILKACAGIATLDHCKLIHASILESRLHSDMLVGKSLVNMYAKCGSFEDAGNVFHNLQDRDVVTWSAMVAGYAEQSDYKSALKYFLGMQKEGLKPNDVTFLSLLSSCSHAGLVDEGCCHFSSMRKDYCVAPTLDHYNCMADLFGRVGRLMEAEDLLLSMPYQPTFVCCMCLLNHCKTFGNLDIGNRFFDFSFNLDSRYSACYEFMSNIYAHAGMWADVERLKELRKCTNAWKRPGKAHVELDSDLHGFIVGDKSHPQFVEIYSSLERLHTQMEEEGYVPHLDLVQQSILDEDDVFCVDVL